MSFFISPFSFGFVSQANLIVGPHSEQRALALRELSARSDPEGATYQWFIAHDQMENEI